MAVACSKKKRQRPVDWVVSDPPLTPDRICRKTMRQPDRMGRDGRRAARPPRRSACGQVSHQNRPRRVQNRFLDAFHGRGRRGLGRRRRKSTGPRRFCCQNEVLNSKYRIKRQEQAHGLGAGSTLPPRLRGTPAPAPTGERHDPKPLCQRPEGPPGGLMRMKPATPGRRRMVRRPRTAILPVLVKKGGF